jgi:class 3 adenylate cyclase
MSNKSYNQCAIMFADIVGSTHLYRQLGDRKAEQLISTSLERMSDITRLHQGVVIKTIGDEIMCRFPSPSSATLAAIEMQQGTVVTANNPQPLDIRIGVHFGNIISKNGDIYGDSVNVAARVAGIAKAKQIITTEYFTLRLNDELVYKTRFFDHIQLKGIHKRIKIYQILWEEDDVTNLVSPEDIPFFLQEDISILLRFSNQEKIYRYQDINNTLSIGRDETCDISINARFISRLHLTLAPRRGKFVLIDHSSNGTYIKFKLQNELFIRREELPLIGEGDISLGENYQKYNTGNIYFKIIKDSGRKIS